MNATPTPGATKAKIVLILGARGRFGAAAVRAFTAAGWRVLAQARSASQTLPNSALPEGAVPITTALEDTAALAAAAAGAEVVVYAVNPIYTDWDAQLLPLARQGMAVAERLGALFMLPGNVYGYGERMPAQLREDTPEQPTTDKGRLRVALEAEMRERAQGGRLRSAVIRAGDFYGGGTGSWLDLAIVKSLTAGKLVYPGPLDVPHAWAYLPDLANAFVALAERRLTDDGAPAFETLHFAGHTLTGHELLGHIEAAAAELGVRPARGFRHGGMPWLLMRALGIFVPMLREVARMSYLWRVPHALDGRRLEARVGPLPSTPPREALRRALAELGHGAAPAGTELASAA